MNEGDPGQKRPQVEPKKDVGTPVDFDEALAKIEKLIADEGLSQKSAETKLQADPQIPAAQQDQSRTGIDQPLKRRRSSAIPVRVPDLEPSSVPSESSDLEPEVIEAIHQASMGNPREEKRLLKSARENPILRQFFKNPSSFSLTSSAPDFLGQHRKEQPAETKPEIKPEPSEKFRLRKMPPAAFDCATPSIDAHEVAKALRRMVQEGQISIKEARRELKDAIESQIQEDEITKEEGDELLSKFTFPPNKSKRKRLGFRGFEVYSDESDEEK